MLIVLVLIVYWPAMHGEFFWDDVAFIRDNPAVQTWDHLITAWVDPRAFGGIQYYPLTYTTSWMEYQLWGTNTFGYHLVNALLHGLNAILCWRLLGQLGLRAAWVAAAIFALHPIQVESVAWMVERKNVLSGAGFLGALIYFSRFFQLTGNSSSSQGTNRDYGIGSALFVAALISKSATVVLPAVLLVLLWWRRGRVERREWVALLPLFLLSAAAGLVTVWVEQGVGGAKGEDWNFSIAERSLIAARAVWFYIAKLAWPADLMLIYPRWQVDTANPAQWLFPAGAIAATAAFWLFRVRIGRGPLTAALCIVCILSPMLGIVSFYWMLFSFVGNHFAYLASIPFIALVVSLGVHFFGMRTNLLTALAGFVLLILSIFTWKESHHYQTAEMMWRTSIADNAHAWVAHHNLGNLLYTRGQLSEAMHHLQQSLSIRPQYPRSHYVLANIYADQKQWANAIHHYESTIRFDPHHAPSYSKLARLLVATGRFDEARKQFATAHRINPDFPRPDISIALALVADGKTDDALARLEQATREFPKDANAHYGLALIFAEKNQIERAAAEYRETIRLDPQHTQAHFNYGLSLMKLGKSDEAITHFREALRFDPAMEQAHNGLGQALAAKGQLDSAIAHFREAVRLKSDYAIALGNLGSSLGQQGKFAEAIQFHQTAVRLKPNDPALHTNFGYALAALGRLDDAEKQFREALRLNPNFVPAKNNLQRLLELRPPDASSPPAGRASQ